MLTHRADGLHKGGLLRQPDGKIDHGDEEGVGAEAVLPGVLYHQLRALGPHQDLHKVYRLRAGRRGGDRVCLGVGLSMMCMLAAHAAGGSVAHAAGTAGRQPKTIMLTAAAARAATASCMNPARTAAFSTSVLSMARVETAMRMKPRVAPCWLS